MPRTAESRITKLVAAARIFQPHRRARSSIDTAGAESGSVISRPLVPAVTTRPSRQYPGWTDEDCRFLSEEQQTGGVLAGLLREAGIDARPEQVRVDDRHEVVQMGCFEVGDQIVAQGGELFAFGRGARVVRRDLDHPVI